MKQKPFFFFRTPVMRVCLFLSIIVSSLFHATRVVWVFYDPATFFLGGARGIFVLSLFSIAVFILLNALNYYKLEILIIKPKIFKILSIIAGVLTAVLTLADVVILAFSGVETDYTIMLYLKRDLPYIFAFTAVLIFALFVPVLKGKLRNMLAIALSVCIVLSCLNFAFPLSVYRFVSDPLVIDTGKDYSVVFATNDCGIAFIKYSYGGREYKTYASNGGRRIGDRLIHNINVPYEHLKNNSYEVGSTHIIEEYSYGSWLGRTITSRQYNLKVNEGKEQTFLVVSDWHCALKAAKKAVANLGSYDSVIMLGDPAAGMDFEEEAVKNLVGFGGDISGGEKPVIYVRGNHETRGTFANRLPDYLGLENLYYSTRYGDYSFLVLDSNEDKEDEHTEYGSMDDYSLYRKQMLSWLNEQPKPEGRLIVLSHDWLISRPEPDVSRAAWDKIDELGASFIISGHLHKCGFLADLNEEEAPEYIKAYPSVTSYIDGGHDGNSYYIASKLTLTPSGVHFEGADNKGQKITDKTLKW